MPQLPALQLDPRNALLDLSPVNNALMNIQKQQNANREYDMQQNQLAMQKQSHDLQAQNYQRQWKQQDVEDMGKRAMAVDAMADGPQKQAIWQRIVQSHGADGLSPEELDYRTGPKMMAAQAGLFRDPMDVEAKRLDMDYKRAQIGKLNREPAGGENPSNVREWEYYTKLGPEQRAEYLNMKRSVPYLDTGTQFVQPNPAGPAQPPRTIDKNVAEAEAQKIVGRETGEGRMALPKMERSLQVYEQQASVMDSEIDRAIAMAGKASTTGFVGAGARFIPGTDAYNLSQTLQTIKANIGFDKLQEMRDNSPTGGALGQVAVQEMQALQSVFGSLDQAQSADQLIRGLGQVKAVRKHFAALRRQAYEQDVKRFGAANVSNPETGAMPKTNAPDPLGIR